MSHNGPRPLSTPAPVVPDDLSGLAGYGSRFPSPVMVGSAAALFDAVSRWDGSESGGLVAAPWAASPWRGPRAESVDDGDHEGSRSRYGSEGWSGSRRFRLTVSPGSVQLSKRDLAAENASLERGTATDRALADLRASELTTVGLSGFATAGDASTGTKTYITEWSRQSRVNMIRTLATLDYAPLFSGGGVPAMVTLTLPGDWLTVAPTAAAYQGMVKAFRKRWERAWLPKGAKLSAVWKKEHQRRGAPHTHLFVTVPQGSTVLDGQEVSFPEWLSRTWAAVVGHPDPHEYEKHVKAGTGIDYADGLRASDPQRLAVYFAKHGDASGGGKEYQNQAPKEWEGASVGRFWGYWGLEKSVATAELSWDDWITASRVVQRHHRAKRLTRRVRVWHPKVDHDTGEVLTKFVVSADGVCSIVERGRWRWTTRRSLRRFSGGSGFVTANDGPAFASAISRAVAADQPVVRPDLAARLVEYKARKGVL